MVEPHSTSFRLPRRGAPESRNFWIADGKDASASQRNGNSSKVTTSPGIRLATVARWFSRVNQFGISPIMPSSPIAAVAAILNMSRLSDARPLVA